jgi:hypothetical protein
MVVISLAAAAGFRAGQGRKAAFRKTIAIRPDAKTGNRNWPCRELNRKRTPIHPRRRSRFGECRLAAVATRTRHCDIIAPPPSDFRHGFAAPAFWIGKHAMAG